MSHARTPEPEEIIGRSERFSQFGAEAVETAAGALAGAAFGALGGPIGVVAGSVFGAIVAGVLSHEAHGEEHETEGRFEALEEETESIREWRSSHPPPPPQVAELAAPQSFVGAMELEELEASLRGYRPHDG